MKKIFLITTLCLTSLNANAAADNVSRPDGHAPIGVMRDHVHKKGESMLSYRYQFMNMNDVYDGNKKTTTSDVRKKYMMAPADMDMRMHMFGAMYGLTDNFTIAAMTGIVEKKMNMVNRMNNTIIREVSGASDTKINAMYQFLKNDNNHAQLNLGVSLPTGDIKRDYNGARLAYPMQNGSGSYEALPGISYSAFANKDYSYGGQLNAVVRLNQNNIGYKLGNSYNATAWAARKLNNAFSLSSRLNYTITERMRGKDSTLALAMSPINNSEFSGRKSLDLLLGVNFIIPKGVLKGNRLALEAGAPIYQRVKGIQMVPNYQVTLGWQKSF